MTGPDELEVELSNHATYYAIAYRHLQKLGHLVAERNAISVQTDDDVDLVCQKNAAITRDAIVTVILSALTLEAFINYYGIAAFSRSFFDNHLDKLNTVTKWLLLPRLAVGKQLSTDGQEYEALRLLFRRRDTLVHYKARSKRVCDLVEGDWISEKDASDAVGAVGKAVSALRAIDNSVDASWIEEAENSPFA